MEIPVESVIGRRPIESSRNTAGRRVATTASWVGLVLASLSCQGCLVLPVRAPTLTNGSFGTMEKINPDFIQVGKTTREEVTAKLSGADTGVKDEQLFVGRWSSSNWGVLWMIAGNYTAEGGWNRGWARHNILIAFDDQGVVQQYRHISDEDLVKQLSAWVAQGQGQPLDLSAPIEVPVAHRHSSGLTYGGTFILENNSFAFREVNGYGKHDFKISPKQIKDLSPASIGQGDKSDPRYTNQTIHFTQKTKVGGKMTIQVDVPTVLTLVKYLAQTRSSQNPPIRNQAGSHSSVSAGTPIDTFAYQIPNRRYLDEPNP